MPQHHASDEVPEWKYMLEYRVRDSSGDVLKQGFHHFRTRMLWHRHLVTNELFLPSVFAGEDSLPAGTRTMFCLLTGLPRRPVRLAIRLVAADPEIRNMSLRIYRQEKRSESDLNYRWQRISQSQREYLTRASVYTPDLMTVKERRNLLRTFWLPLAPRGVTGEDYEQRSIYTLRDIPGRRVRPEPTFTNVVDSEWSRVITLPSEPGRVRYEFQELEARNGRTDPIDVQIHWYGQRMHERSSHNLEITPAQSFLELASSGGLHEITSSSPITVRAFWWPTGSGNPGQTQEITPDTAYSRYYLTAKGEPVEFEIVHVDEQQSTPFRVSLRRINNAAATHTQSPTLTPTAAVHREFSDATGEVIGAGEIVSDAPVSRFDHPTNPTIAAEVSDVND